MDKFFYQLSVGEAVARLKSHREKGLSALEAKKRLEQYGLNQLKEGKRRPVVFRLFGQFKDLMIVVLIVAAFLAYWLGDFRGGTILIIIVLGNAIIGFYQEYKAERILASLKKMVRTHAIVIRDGQRVEVDGSELVPGDLVYLEEGVGVPADVRLVEDTGFSTNDFILTGESAPQVKRADLVIDEQTTVSNQDNLVFLGTTVAKGNALALVYGTGMDTAIGRIAKTSESIVETISPLQQELNSLAKILTKIAGAIALLLFVVNLLLRFGNYDSLHFAIKSSFLFAISVAAACVPQGLPAQVSVALSMG
ncbi:MAG: cation-transporting P-type ATPase, partial [Candidatus Peregrinibacteria bacterium]